MTQYLKEKEIDNNTILKISNDLKKGKIVISPTDTVYGIMANAYDKKAVEKIYEVKGRPKSKPLCVLISDISMLEEMVEYISPTEQKLIDTFWPGPLTILFKKRKGVLSNAVSTNEYVGVRLIKEGLTYKLIQKAGVPIVAPSANLSGSPTGTKIKNIINELGGKVDYILNCGDIKNDTVSTIVQIEDEKVIVIREGKIRKDELQKRI